MRHVLVSVASTLLLACCGVAPPTDFGQATPFSNSYIAGKGCSDGNELQIVEGTPPNSVLQLKPYKRIWLWLEGESKDKVFDRKMEIECRRETLKPGQKLWYLSPITEPPPQITPN